MSLDLYEQALMKPQQARPDARAWLGMEAANALDYPVMIVGPQAQILFANPASDYLLTHAQAPYRNVCGIMTGRSHSADSELSKALHLATDAAAGRAVTFAIRSPGTRLPYQVAVAPIRTGPAQSTDGRRPLALVSLSNPHASATPGIEQLRSLFGLTLAEARLVGALASGDSLAACAARAGVTINTARSHLKAALAKTGTHRQSELLKLVDALPRLRYREGQRPW